MVIKVGIVGGTGKLGKDILLLLQGQPDMEAVAVVARSGSPFVGRDVAELVGATPTGHLIAADIRETFGQCDVYIDCAGAEAFLGHASAYLEAERPVILASTGYGTEGEERIRLLAGKVAVVVCPNFSTDVYKFMMLVRYAAQLFGNGADMDILEAHHKGKKDSPSGTALKLREVMEAELRKADEAEKITTAGAAAEAGPVAIHSIRAGNVVGEHSVMFTLAGNERITLSHVAGSRSTFAEGVLHTVRWIVHREPGLYGPEEVFGGGLPG
jgi:4-hydroxy-tetrahydrodipicolinate reductase